MTPPTPNPNPRALNSSTPGSETLLLPHNTPHPPPPPLPHKGQGRSLKSTGPPRPASASSRDMMTAMAASSLLGLLEPGSSMMSMLRWELSPLDRGQLVETGQSMFQCVCVRLTHDGLIGVRVAHRVWSRKDPCAWELRRPSILDLETRGRRIRTPTGIRGAVSQGCSLKLWVANSRRKAMLTCSQANVWVTRV